VSAAVRVTTIPGSGPIVLLAPHGGRRDPARRMRTAGRLRVNDLHTAELTAELAALLGATALVNARQDRNEVDWNRISAAHAEAPDFLERLAAVLTATIARHGRATVLVIHGWNVIQPVVDLGLGCLPGADPFAADPSAAVSPGFAATGVRALADACVARGITATVGARYPARHRENLLQLFTPRYRDDPRPRVRALATLAAYVDAVQLELGIVLRWPGPWRGRLLAACVAARPMLEAPPRDDAGHSARPEATSAQAGGATVPRLEFVSPRFCGLAGLDPGGGGRLLLFPPTGGLVLFTGERTGGDAPGCVGTLAFQPAAGGGLAVRCRGPLLHFPDTSPFLDLEPGLETARLVEGDVALDLVPDHTPHERAVFGSVTGRVTLDGTAHAIAGHGFADDRPPSPVWPRLRAAFRLASDASVVLTVGLDGTHADGWVRRDARHDAVVGATVDVGPYATERGLRLDLELASGERLTVAVHAMHRLPVLRTRGPTPGRFELRACRLGPGGEDLAGWCEIGGL
jgi:hypothetical protein